MDWIFVRKKVVPFTKNSFSLIIFFWCTVYKDENQGFYDEYKTKGIFQFGKVEIIKNKITFLLSWTVEPTRNLIVALSQNKWPPTKRACQAVNFRLLRLSFSGKK